MKNGWLSVVKLDQVYSNTRVPSTNTSQHESTRINMSPARVNTSQTQVRHESTRTRHESTRIKTSPTRINTNQHESV